LFNNWQESYAHSAFFYVELLCNVWFIIELFIRFIVSNSIAVRFLARALHSSLIGPNFIITIHQQALSFGFAKIKLLDVWKNKRMVGGDGEWEGLRKK